MVSEQDWGPRGAGDADHVMLDSRLHTVLVHPAPALRLRVFPRVTLDHC